VRCSPCTRWVDARPRPDPALAPARRVRFGAGTVGTDRALDEREYAVLSELDRAGSVAEAIERLAGVGGGDPHALRPDVLAFVRQGLGSGLLEPRATAER
jgi:hypothetical protein